MRTFEYSVSSKATAKDGMAKVEAICGYIINATHRTLIEEGYGMCLLSRCRIEIDERPKLGETVTVMVNSSLNNIVTLLNRVVSITDSEGNEIGRGRIDWLMPSTSQVGDVFENPSHLARRFINKFHDIMPDIDAVAGLQMIIDLDFREEARLTSDFSVSLKKICDSSFFFLARSGSDTLCRAMLQTA